MTLSTRLRQAMQDAGINQAELARRCEVSPPSVNGWLSGKSKFLRGENLLRAANVLGVADLWLATGKGPKIRSLRAEVHEDAPDYRLDSSLDEDVVMDVARALLETHEELGITYDFCANPQLFIDAYRRAATFGNFAHGRGKAWLGSHISNAVAQGASTDERTKGDHVEGVPSRSIGGTKGKG